MKVLQIMPEMGLAGAETMCESLCNELKAIGCDVILVSLYDYQSAITRRLQENNIKIYFLKKKHGLDITIIFKLLSLFFKEKPQCVHTHRYVMRYVIPAAFLSRVPTRIHTVHNVAQKENTPIGIFVNRYFYRYFNVIPVALSNQVLKTIVDVYGLSPTSIPVIFNGIDLKKCIRKSDYSSDNCFTILHIGRFAEAKNHRLILNTFRKIVSRHPNTQLKLIGAGKLLSEIKSLAKELEIEDKVCFLGQIDNIYPILHDADIFILPSEYEGMPMTLIEAMGTGVPIIASNVGGIPDMLTNDVDALLIKPDINDLFSAIEKLILNKEKREMLGKNALIRAQEFSSKIMAQKYYKLYTGNK